MSNGRLDKLAGIRFSFVALADNTRVLARFREAGSRGQGSVFSLNLRLRSVTLVGVKAKMIRNCLAIGRICEYRMRH